LLDEVEIGLEPHRITRMLKYIKNDTSGQYFLTSHSPVVLRELTINDLYIVHNSHGEIQIIATTGKNLDDLNIQGNIRASAEAFLAKKIIVCEGQTEQGFLRGLDNYWVSKKQSPFSFQGVAILNAGGANKIKGIADGLLSLYYDVAVFADGDAQDKFSNQDADDLRENNVEVIMWADNIALEDRIMIDLPWAYVLESVKFAKTELRYPIHDNVRSKLNKEQPADIDQWVDSFELRRAIGKAAKSSSWFKDISRGEKLVEIISPGLDQEIIKDTELVKKINNLRRWIDRD